MLASNERAWIKQHPRVQTFVQKQAPYTWLLEFSSEAPPLRVMSAGKITSLPAVAPAVSDGFENAQLKALSNCCVSTGSRMTELSIQAFFCV
jgi:hypothetical protein